MNFQAGSYMVFDSLHSKRMRPVFDYLGIAAYRQMTIWNHGCTMHDHLKWAPYTLHFSFFIHTGEN